MHGSSQPFTLTLPLPANYRPGDILAFHRRDPQAVAERVHENRLEKALLWRGNPACLTLRFASGEAHAALAVASRTGAVEGVREIQETREAQEAPKDFAAMLQRMLGLTQAVEAFEQQYRQHPEFGPLLGPLLARQPGLRVALTATPFEALSWAITGQQISVSAALSLRRKLILAAGLRHPSGLYCYPGAPQVAALSADTLRQAGFSASKARTLQAVAHAVMSGELPLDAWARDFPGPEPIRQRLLAIRGIGPWAADYALLRGYGWLDGSLHGDAAVRRGLQTLLGTNEKIDADTAENWLARFTPWRALIGAHLWAMQAAPEITAAATTPSSASAGASPRRTSIPPPVR